MYNIFGLKSEILQYSNMVMKKDEVKKLRIDARWPIPLMVCSTGKRQLQEDIYQSVHPPKTHVVAGTEK